MKLKKTINNDQSLDDNYLKGIEVVVVDYGMGNQLSLINALESIGAYVSLTDVPEKIYSAKVVILPGVGSFPCGMEELEKRNLKETLMRRFKEKNQLLEYVLVCNYFLKEVQNFLLLKALVFLIVKLFI